MAEYIDKEAIMGTFKAFCADYLWNGNHSDFRAAPQWNDAVDIVLHSPPADVVEVVRCKDCRHYDKGACWDQAAYGRCWREDDYCSYGERRK